ncbi:MAG: hypothetical protein QNJ47_17780 [Nostocaceae cyanobacterium]|nr:hypothetical protein [Nostocaceae cyanobacterium]
MLNHSFWTRITKYTLLFTLCSACAAPVTTEKKQVNQIKEEKSQPHIVYGDLIIKETSDYLMIPVGISPDNNQEGAFLFSSSRYPEADKNIYNLIFYSKKDGTTNILLNKKALISEFKLLSQKKEDGKLLKQFWLYKIIDSDTNGNKKLDTKDGIIGYISDLSGKNLKQVTPNNTQIMSWVVVQSIGAMFIKIVKDSNKDKKFTDKDETAFIKVNLDEPKIGSEIISDELEQEIKSYILE